MSESLAVDRNEPSHWSESVWESRLPMGQTTSTASPASSSLLDTNPAQCPIQHSPSSPSQKCPVDHDALASSSTSGSGSSSSPHPSEAARCPVDHGKSGELNPLNQMPTLAQERAPGQTQDLPLEREVSSIPRATDSSKWEYPSAQQFYNALVRKGWETPEEHVQTMVDIHNFLNEEAWQEILKWEPAYVFILFLLRLYLLRVRGPYFLFSWLEIRNRICRSLEGNQGNYHQKLVC